MKLKGKKSSDDCSLSVLCSADIRTEAPLSSIEESK